MHVPSVYCAVRTGCVYVIHINFHVEVLNRLARTTTTNSPLALPQCSLTPSCYFQLTLGTSQDRTHPQFNQSAIRCTKDRKTNNTCTIQCTGSGTAVPSCHTCCHQCTVQCQLKHDAGSRDSRLHALLSTAELPLNVNICSLPPSLQHKPDTNSANMKKEL